MPDVRIYVATVKHETPHWHDRHNLVHVVAPSGLRTECGLGVKVIVAAELITPADMPRHHSGQVMGYTDAAPNCLACVCQH